MNRTFTSGSAGEFDREWKDALEHNKDQYLIYPTFESTRQQDVFEWIKGNQVQTYLKSQGIISGRVLEYGCGAAGMSLYLASFGYESYICDLSRAGLRIAEINQIRHAPAQKFHSKVMADGRRLPYEDGYFDVVMSFGLLEHFEPEALDQLLKETIRILKPGGAFVADIIPGPERMNIRTIGLLISYFGSLMYHFFTLKWKRIPKLFRLYFENFYETSYSAQEWENIIRKQGIIDLQVAVCRPFPSLALPRRLESLYTNMIKRNLEFHLRFDRAQNRWTKRWGWMYLATCIKSGE